MIDVYKYVHGLYKTQNPLFTLSQTKARTNSLKISKPHWKEKVRSNYFMVRVVNTWNSLPEYVVTAPNLNTFKARLDSFWKGLATTYDPDCYKTV